VRFVCCEVAVGDRGQRDGVNEDEETFEIHLGQEDRALQRLRWRGKRLVDFAIMQQLLLAGTWADVVRYDCCHGTFHVHRFTRWGRESRTEIGDLSDLDWNFDYAADAVVAGWETNRWRYLNG
jgi:hypothetical protein